jgi:hypothetical protein
MSVSQSLGCYADYSLLIFGLLYGLALLFLPRGVGGELAAWASAPRDRRDRAAIHRPTGPKELVRLGADVIVAGGPEARIAAMNGRRRRPSA